MQVFVSNKSINPEPRVIIWSKYRTIKWSDFKKKNPNLDDKASANAAIGFQSTPLIEHIKIKNKFKFKIIDMRLNAVFIPEFSWVMKNVSVKGKTLLLKHEQGHFDLAEEIIRKTRTKLINHFQGRVFIINEKTKDTAKKGAILQVTKIRKDLESRLQKDFKKQEKKYDVKTNHGLIMRCQDDYNKRFKKLRQ